MIQLLTVLGTFIVMEGVAWFTHKYVMHKLLWRLHRDHHLKDHDSWWERNDLFFLIFATPSCLLIVFGTQQGAADLRIWMGAGIALYGLAYFLVHEIFIHQRFNVFKRTDSIYLRAIRKAHKIHHKHLDRHDGECFGMLWVPLKYFREARKSAAAMR